MGETPWKRYRFLSGPDDAAFCAHDSEAQADGCVLYGDPELVIEDNLRIVGQAVCLPDVLPATRSN